MRWSPHITVATVLEKDGRLLFVEELIDGQHVLNQPAGHWENGETLIEASIRETREETAWVYEPHYLVGIYQWRHPQKQHTFLRFCFGGELLEHHSEQALDKEIVRTIWLDRDELLARQAVHRSPLVLTCVEDYLAGQRYELSLLKHF